MISALPKRRRCRLRGSGLALLGILAALSVGASTASATAPSIGAVWSSATQPTTVRLNAEVNPNGKSSTYHYDYITKAAYDANVNAAKDGFTGASRLPVLTDTIIAGTAPTTIGPLLSGLTPDTAYRYRLVIKNADGTTTGSPLTLATYSAAPFALPDGRGWEMVSPVEKNGGQVEAPGALAGGGVLQVAADGQSVTWGSDASFAGGAQGAAPASQYVSSRTSGWSTLNITPPLVSGSYGTGPDGVPYQLFSSDLARGVMLNGRPCRGEATGCPVANPPLAGTDAPVGYQNYYLRESGSFEALMGAPDIADMEIDPADFELTFAGASPDLRHSVLSTCAALTANATEVPLGAGCDPAKQNLYRHSAGSLSLINILPAQSQGNPGAALGAQSGAVSTDGTRIYWSDTATGTLYLREGVQTFLVGIGTFQTASTNGSTAFYIDALGHLQSYSTATHTSTDLTPLGGVSGVLGASGDGASVYYATASGLFLRKGATTTPVTAAAVDASNWPPSTGTARVSSDGTKLVFVSTAAQTGYDNKDIDTGVLDSQVYLYDSTGAGTLTCVSCNPTFGRPIGASTIPGAIANGTTPGATASYKPRILSADGRRVFFDSEDALVLSDVNLDFDVYQWEAQGSGSCTRAGGCIALISSGLANRARFVDASTDGADAFFITDRSLVGVDPGSVDLYDARIGGGFPEPSEPSPCNGDACQIVPPAPEDPILTTVLPGPGNPNVYYRKDRLPRQKCPAGKKLKTVKTKSGKKVKKCVKATSKKRSARASGGPR